MGINQDVIREMEIFINSNRNLLQTLECSHKQIYEKQSPFAFLTGHKMLLSSLPEYIKSWKHEDERHESSQNHPHLSSVLNAMLEAAVRNANLTPNNYRYSKLLMDFAIYIFLIGGKSCYKILCNNLPLPKIPTISEYGEKNWNRIPECFVLIELTPTLFPDSETFTIGQNKNNRRRIKM